MMYIDYREFYKEGILEKYSDKIRNKERLKYDLRVLKEDVKNYLKEYFSDVYDYINNIKLDVFDLFQLDKPNSKIINIENELMNDTVIFDFKLEYFRINREIKFIDDFFGKKFNYINQLFDIDLNKFKIHLKLANDFYNGFIGFDNLISYILNDVYRSDKFFHYISKQGNIDDFVYVIYKNVGAEYKIFYKLILDEVKVQFNKNIDKKEIYYEMSKFVWSMNNE